MLTDVEGKLRDKDIELGRFQEELDSSRRSMELMERQYSEMKDTAGMKDSLVTRLRQENDSMAEKLDQAYREKTSAVQKLNLVQSDMSSLSVEKV
jgi:Skp family chaperone for outer membrane proteins